jgi:uncharacterized UBP type Zn finger protein
MFSMCLSEEFDNFLQQDAHEFLIFLINQVSEAIMGMLITSTLEIS